MATAMVSKSKASRSAQGASSDGGVTKTTRPKQSSKRATDDAASTPAKKRRAATPAPAPVQKNTLDRWFGVSKKADPPKEHCNVEESDEEAEENAETAPEVHSPAPKPREKVAVTKQKNTKLVQRRILLSDQCRVCESAKTETSSRCELKCMSCEMTVHTSCYGADEEEAEMPEKWNCRPCTAIRNLDEEQPVSEDADDEEEGKEPFVRGIPVHEVRGEGGRFHGLYESSDFAAVFLFLKRFRRLGLKLGVDVTINTLAEALLSPRDHSLLYELHTRLLQNVGATISKNSSWVDNLIRFLKGSEYPVGGELVRRLAACGNANDWLSTYYDVPVGDRVALLKVLCEAQFDENDMLVEKIGKDETTPESLREDVLGQDAAKRSYYLLEDPSNFAEGSAWLCRCQTLDGSNWQTVSDDLASLQSFVRALSYSTETADLQLWQSIAGGVAKSLERREKKKHQKAQRVARMPRMLRSTGLDMTSILPESSGRSLRTRKAVNYRSYMSDEEEPDDDESDAGQSGEEDEEEDEEDGESGGRDRKRRRLPEEQPTRTSRRLRGGETVSSSPRSSRSSRSSRRRGDTSDDDDAQHEEENSESEAGDDEEGGEHEEEEEDEEDAVDSDASN